MLERAAAARAVGHDEIGVLVKPDVLPGEGQELAAQAVGEVRKAAADVVLPHDPGRGPQDLERLGRRRGKHHPHAAAVEIGHLRCRRDRDAGGRRLLSERGRPGEGGEEMRPGVLLRRHAVGEDAAEAE